jgi:hypothetical protein
MTFLEDQEKTSNNNTTANIQVPVAQVEEKIMHGKVRMK